jgi:hypothetical protein
LNGHGPGWPYHAPAAGRKGHPDGSYRSVLLNPQVSGASRKRLTEAARNIRQSAQISAQIRQFTVMMAAKIGRKLDNGARRLREADRCLKRPASKYSFRKAGQARRPTRRVAAKVLTLHPAMVQ